MSTVRIRLRDVHFDGRNRARGPGEPGGASDPNPDVRNGIGVEGGLVELAPAPDPAFFFRPVNAALDCERCRFSDLPAQAGIFVAQPVGRNDPAWRFGGDAVAAGVHVTNSVFERIDVGVIVADVSDAEVAVARSAFRRTAFGVIVHANVQSVEGGVIGPFSTRPPSRRAPRSAARASPTMPWPPCSWTGTPAPISSTSG